MLRSLAILLVFILCSVNGDKSPFLDEKMEIGYIDVGRGEIFYWFFRARNEQKTTPVLLWLTGGPGCSSAIALFYENGPYHVNEGGSALRKNPYSWNEKAHIIFVDQPVGTGFSTAKNYVVNEEQVSHDMMIFLEKFMDKHHDIKNNSFFISGESYAGHYIPAVGAYIARHSEKIKLKGVAIGNGLVSPYYQYPAYSQYAYDNQKINGFSKLLLDNTLKVCQLLIRYNLWPLATFVCQFSLIYVMGIPLYPWFNPYDITKKCDRPPLCYDFSDLHTFLSRRDIRNKIEPKVNNFYSCNFIVRIFLLADWWFDFADDVRYLLDDKKLAVMVYSGDLDFICNWKGSEEWTHNFAWSKKKEFSDLEYKQWNETYPHWEKSPAEYKALGNFSFIRVYKAGHMVPMDKPEYSLEMINEFMYNGIK